MIALNNHQGVFVKGEDIVFHDDDLPEGSDITVPLSASDQLLAALEAITPSGRGYYLFATEEYEIRVPDRDGEILVEAIRTFRNEWEANQGDQQ